MKVKRILRFYFCADSLEKTFDGLIMKTALSAAGKSCFPAADRLCRIIEEKGGLASLWRRLDGIISKLPSDVRADLEEYARARCGIGKSGAYDVKRLKRAVMQFRRRAQSLDGFSKGAELVDKYYCLINVV